MTSSGTSGRNWCRGTRANAVRIRSDAAADSRSCAMSASCRSAASVIGRRLPAGSGGRFVRRSRRRQAARDHLRDAVAGHRDAVEAVGGLHRALLVCDDDELRAVGEAAQQRQEAVDVEVVERRLDLVENVERARPGEEDREQEGERGHRLLAARQQRQPLRRLARGRDLDLDAHAVLGRGFLGLGRLLDPLVVGGRALVGAGAAQHGAWAGVLAYQPQPPPASREQLADDLLEVLRGRRERLLERVADPLVGVADQALELAQGGLEVLALALELLYVLDRFRVLLLRERVDGAELLAPAPEPLDASLEIRALGVGQRLVGGLRLEAELRRQLLELAARVLVAVARLLRPDFAAGDVLAARLQARLDLDLLLRARAQLGGEALAGVAVGDQLGVENLHASAERFLGRLEHGGEPPGGRAQALVVAEPVALVRDPPLALRSLSLGALGQPPLGGERRADLRAARRDRALVRCLATLLDEVAGVPLRLERVVARAGGRSGGTVGVVARGVRGLDARGRGLDLGQRGLLGPRRLLDPGDQGIAAVALGEDPVLAARGHLPQLARSRRPHAPVAGHGDPAEARVEPAEVVDDPDGGEQRAGKPRRRSLTGCRDPVDEPLGAARGRRAVGGGRRRVVERPQRCARGRRARGGGRRRRRVVGRDQRSSAVATRAVEQPRRLVDVGGHRRPQARAERGRQRELVTRLRRQRVGQRRGAARRSRLRAQELVDLREFGADARGLAAGGVGGPLELAAGAAGRLGRDVGLLASRRAALRLGGQPRRFRRGGGPALLQLGDLAREALRAVLGELLELGLERRDALARAVVARVLLGLGAERVEQRAPARSALGQRRDRLARRLEPHADPLVRGPGGVEAVVEPLALVA